MVTALFNRLGNGGVLLIAGALLLGGLAGAVVVDHYESQGVASQQHEDHDAQNLNNNKPSAEQTQAGQQDQQGDQRGPAGQDQQQNN